MARRKRAASSAQFVCDVCEKVFGSKSHVTRHALSHMRTRKKHAAETRPRHLSYQLKARASSKLPAPEHPMQPPSEEQLLADGYNPEIISLIRENWRFACTSYRPGRLLGRYNFRLRPGIVLDIAYLTRLLKSVHAEQKRPYRMNFDFSVILHNPIKKIYRFFWPGNPDSIYKNNRFYARPVQISSSEELREHLQHLTFSDLFEHVSMARPDSQWNLYSLIGVTVNTITNAKAGVLMGAKGRMHLPDYLTNSKSIYTVQSEKPDDFLCFFRCLAKFQLIKEGLVANRIETKTLELAREYSVFLGLADVAYNKGIKETDLFHLEKLFKIRIFIYRLLPPDLDSCTSQNAEIVRINSSLSKKQAVGGDLLLDLYKFPNGSSHLSLITKFDSYCKAYSCSTCGYYNNKKQLIKKHEKICGRSSEERMRCSSGAYAPQASLFDELEAFGIVVHEQERWSVYVSSWDLETLENPLETVSGVNLKWNASLELLSCAVASNCPSFTETRFFRRISDVDELTDRIVDYMLAISAESDRLNRLRLSGLYRRIDTRIEELNRQSQNSNAAVVDFANARLAEIKALHSQLDKFCKQHAFFAYNSASFDIKVWRDSLYRTLMRKGVKIDHIIKKNSSYMYIATESIVFKDACFFTAAGVSLQGFVTSQGLELQKQSFPYGLITSLDVLDTVGIPPKESFYNALKNSHITDDDYEEFQRLYEAQGCTDLWSVLRMYNISDSDILLSAVLRMIAFWREQGIDLVSQSHSLPSLASRLLSKLTPEECPLIYLPDKSNFDLYRMVEEGLVGGPSIVFKRLSCCGVTRIRGGNNYCRRVVGLDANSLYLYCMQMALPSSIPVRWRPKQNDSSVFKREFCLPPYVTIPEVEYCLWLQKTLGAQEGAHLNWFYNRGQKRFGKKHKYSFDAYNGRTRTAYSFQGCYHHYCQQCAVGQRAFDQNPDAGLEKRKSDLYRNQCFEAAGLTHEIMWECSWRQHRKNPLIKQFLAKKLYSPHWHTSHMTQDRILRDLLNDNFCAIMKVDMACPGHLLDYFAEFPAIFVNTDISMEMVTEEMRQVARKYGLLKQPRRSLVSVRSLKNVVLISPLVKWMLQHGMVCSKVHKCYEFKPSVLFGDFCERVTFHRTQSDKNPTLKCAGDAWKVAGNSSFGRLLLRKDKFLRTEIFDEQGASGRINSKSFRSLECVTGDPMSKDARYELNYLPRRYTESTPRYLGLWVLGLAKLVLLNFYHRFVRKYWELEDFELQYTDTDSMYFEISAGSWEEFEQKVKPHLRREYETDKSNFICDEGTKRIEYLGRVSVYLASKAYICSEQVTREIAERCSSLLEARTNQQWPLESEQFALSTGGSKFSSKGVNQRLNSDILNVDNYLGVLESRDIVEGQNRGFRAVGGTVSRYTLDKCALTYLYVKRKVNADFSTSPLW